jgi:aldehyde:ferredoxin oxidoreductase
MTARDLGKVLFVDLTSGSIKEAVLEEKLHRQYLGGVGLGVRILYERMKPKVDPLGPENILGFVPGLLTGAPVPAAPRYMVVAKSPLTGTWGDANAGGFFGRELRAAGFIAVFFSGVSPKPVYLWLNDGKAELRDAAHLWGKDTYQTVEILLRELGDPKVRVACIGPAGENQSLLASVMNDVGDAAGRSGLGAVMGAKRLKAIAVRGTGKVPLADKERLDALRRGFLQTMEEVYSPLRKYGTLEETVEDITLGIAGIKNWSLLGAEAFPNHARFDGDELINKYETGKHTCWGCPIACKGYFRIEKGTYAIGKTPKTEYETIAAFGPMCFIDDVEAIIKAGDICNRYGIDTISAGSTIAFAMECYENGIISKKETDGIELTWGNAPAMLAMLDKMGRREGFGAVLADGVKKASERIGRGSEKWAVHVHGQEPGFQDARFWPGRGLIYFVDPTPGRHTAGILAIATTRRRNIAPYPEMQFPKKDLLDYPTVGPMHARGSIYYQFINACGFCLFACGYAPMPTADYVAAVTGWDFSMAEGLKAGWRIQTLRQSFNVREGLRPEDFRLPERISKPSMAGQFVGRQIDFNALRESFFAALGWDVKSGWPTEATLRELGLMELVGADRKKALKER